MRGCGPSSSILPEAEEEIRTSEIEEFAKREEEGVVRVKKGRKEKGRGVKEIQELLFIQYEMAVRNANLVRKLPTTLEEIDRNPSVSAWCTACHIAGIPLRKLNAALYKEIPVLPKRNCLERFEHHCWDTWHYDSKKKRYLSECTLMGCDAACWVKDVIATEQPVLKEGAEHVHEWSWWKAREPFHVEDNLPYQRDCTCGAWERVGSMRPQGDVTMVRGNETWDKLLDEMALYRQKAVKA